ncbi:MAG: outer membrane protein assembly factor BamA [Bacteroidaceae bacterium]|nr:outer membrane protein assembly factor BamA [Bacteroidaceae bacterium]
MNSILRKYISLVFLLLFTALSTKAQTERIIAPNIDYSRTPRQYTIGGISIEGVQNYEDYVIIGLSGLSKGQKITIPGEEITKAIKRYWKNGLFSNVSISVDSLVADSAFLHIKLAMRPRISQINYTGVKKSEREDLEEKLGLIKDYQLTPNLINRTKLLTRRYFDEKGYKNADIEVVQHDDISNPGKVILEINIDKKEKVRVNSITITGNKALSTRKIKGNLFKNGVFKKTHERHMMSSWFRSKKYIEENWNEDKNNLIAKYAELGYRDAQIVSDSVVSRDDNLVDIYINVDEGRRYYIRNVEWVGNTLYSSDMLNEYLRMKKGDVYNQRQIDERTRDDEDAIGNLYYNNGYVFYQLDPRETNIVGDSVDLEMRIQEGPQAYISHVTITGNDRVYEDVVRRELRTKPGDLFSKKALERSYREIASMGHFDPEHIDYKIEPNQENGTVDMAWNLTPKSNDQVEFSLGYGQTGVIGKIGLKFNNFCMANLFKKGGLRRGILPNGNGETFSISGQTNGRYYQSYSISYLNPWFGGKRPTSLSLSAFFSRQTDVSDRYYNSAYYNSYYNYLYGYGNSYSNYYENFYDADKYVMIYGATLGWGKRLSWPDDYFQLSAELSYTRYNLKQWRYFLITDGTCNNLNLGLTIARSSTDNPIYPRSGSEFVFSVNATPPYSLIDGKDYANLANNEYSATYQKELQQKYKWIEYHKWKFKSRTFTALTGQNKCPVLMTRVEFGILGSYSPHKRSPFETFYMGGDGMSGYSYSYATETIGLRGYDNGSLTPSGYSGYAYDRFTLELRYPFILGNSTNIYGLAFVEGGNAWSSVKDFNPFDMKRSAGVGVRIFLPMVGLLGIDWAYGFDKVFGRKGGSNFHFVLGQEF